MEPTNELSGLLGYVREGGVLHGDLDWLVHILEWVVTGIDLAGIALLLIGAARFITGVVVAELSRGGGRARGLNAARIGLGRYILAGLELMIVGDIVHTALSLAMADLVFLALLVVVRSLISFFLDRELSELQRQSNE